MKLKRDHFSPAALFILLSIFLIAAGISRWIETDSGNILVHDITAESYEGFPYGARLFRPLQASSLNRRPSVLLIFGNIADRYSGDHIAMEFARRGFTVLTMEDFDQGITGSRPDYETENIVDAGYTFLATRSFTDPERIGLVTFYRGAEKAVVSKDLPLFTSSVFISPPAEISGRIPSDTRIFLAKFETDREFIIHNTGNERSDLIPAFHSEMIISPYVISSVMELFHTDLAIPNDSPFWFDSESQSAQLLVGIRGFLLPLLFLICAGFSSILTSGTGNHFRKGILGFFIPLLLFALISDLMNFFPISVRLGSPFHYLPNIRQILHSFSLPLFLCFAAAVIILSIPLGKLFFSADCFAAVGLISSAFVLLPVRLTGSTGWASQKIGSFKWALMLITIYACLVCIIIRIPKRGRLSQIISACLTGAMFYFYCCDLLANLFS